MILKGDRCYLKQAVLEDADDIIRWENDTDHWLVSNTITTYSKEEVEHFIENENDIFINNQMRLMIKTNSEISVGCVDLFDFDMNNRRVGIGILVDPDYRGQGFGHDALVVLKQFCFNQLDVNSIYADVLVNNASSIKLFESVGFELSGVRKDWIWDGTSYLDQNFYQIFKAK